MKQLSSTEFYRFEFEFGGKEYSAVGTKRIGFGYGEGLTYLVDIEDADPTNEMISYAESEFIRLLDEKEGRFKEYDMAGLLYLAHSLFTKYYKENEGYDVIGILKETGQVFMIEDGSEDLCIYKMWHSKEYYDNDENHENNADGGNIMAYEETPPDSELEEQARYLAILLGYDEDSVDAFDFNENINEINLDSNLKDNEQEMQ